MQASKRYDAVTFGEIMLRLSPPGTQRFAQSTVFEKQTGGAELNVAMGLAALGLRPAVVSRLPDNEISRYLARQIQAGGVSGECLIYDADPNARLGIYYYESGAAPRKPSVVYDRKNSAVNHISPREIPDELYSQARLFHTCGISLALGGAVRQTAVEMMRRFKQAGALVSFDVNYRANLWGEEEARAAIEDILPLVDILFISEETSRRMFQKQGELKDIMKSYCAQYGVQVVATTQRQVISPQKHHFGSLIYGAQEDAFFTEEPYRDIQVIDRIGSGDAFVAGALFGLLQYGDLQRSVEYGNAMAALKNTVAGDLPCTSLQEVNAVIAAHHGGGVQSEMNR